MKLFDICEFIGFTTIFAVIACAPSIVEGILTWL